MGERQAVKPMRTNHSVQLVRKAITKLTSKVVLQFDLSVEVVGGGPGLSEADTIGLVSVLGLKITKDDTGLVVALTVDLESLWSRRKKVRGSIKPSNHLIFLATKILLTTPSGVVVLTSSLTEPTGKSLERRSLLDLPISLNGTGTDI
jgi:hypothetical protein